MKRTTTWGSRNAEDLFKIATCMANFNPAELMLEISRRSPRGAKVKASTVEEAMGAISRGDPRNFTE